jgi:hypothetical protein
VFSETPLSKNSFSHSTDKKNTEEEDIQRQSEVVTKVQKSLQTFEIFQWGPLGVARLKTSEPAPFLGVLSIK